VGPDIGLLIAAAGECGGAEAAFEFSKLTYLLSPVSRTFHGRDIFAPAAAHIATGVDPDDLGPRVDCDGLVQLEMPESWVHDDHVHAEVLQVDRFGNLQLNVALGLLEQLELLGGSPLEVRMEGHRLTVPFARTFADVETGEFLLVEDSYQRLSLAINNGDAAGKLQAAAGSTAIIGPARV
jgi:S-adenosyl-L-methionine hydrolase (adenosine-forming)